LGKNFVPSNHVILRAANGLAYTLQPPKLDSNSIAVTVPAGLAAGTYKIWVGELTWSVTSSAAAEISIYAPQLTNVEIVTCSGLVSDGASDNTDPFQKCLDRYAPPSAANYLVYFDISAGTYALFGTITPRPYDVIVGSSTGRTLFVGRPPGASPEVWFNVPQHFGMVNISFQGPPAPFLLLGADATLGAPRSSGHLFFYGVNFESTSDSSNEVMFSVSGPDIQVYLSSFASGSNQEFDITFRDEAVVAGNQFILSNLTGLELANCQNVIFENNFTFSHNIPGQGPNGKAAGSGLSVARANGASVPSAVLCKKEYGSGKNHYIGWCRW
jgi:hypothetical protein